MTELKRLLFVISLLIIASSYANAQCTQILNQAEDEFEAGRILGIPGMLEECLETGGFSKEETIRAHKLLTQVYIFSDQEARADESMIDLLHADPEHQLDREFDPAELFYLYDQFRTEPIFRLGLKVGGNRLDPVVLEEFSTIPNDTSFKVYTPGIGFQIEGSIERHFIYGIEGSLGFMFRSSRFEVLESYEKAGLEMQIVDTQNWLTVPLQARYNLRYGQRRGAIPYVLAGAAFNYLLSAAYIDSQRSGGLQESVTRIPLLSNDERNTVNYSGFLGLGVKLRNQTHFITLEARYELTTRNYVNPENRYINNENIAGLAYVTDDLTLSFISFTFGYTRSIYNPKKKKKFIR